MFFIIVLQTLLIISGTVEINPGPVITKKTNLSFAVWNLDSIPARDYARIPLIEAFQATHEFDIFGVCESLLNKNIPNDDIFISVFLQSPFGLINLKILGMGEPVCISKKICQLRKGVIWNLYRKQLLLRSC